MKKTVSLLLVFILALGFAAGTPFAPAVAADTEAREWFFIDVLDDVSVTGQAALDILGDMDEVILALEGQSEPFTRSGQRAYYAPPNPALDMSVYDVRDFKSRSGWKVDTTDNVVVLSSAYEAAEYMMYRIMSGTGYHITYGNWGGVYTAVFKPDADIYLNQTNAILNEIANFIYAYFPHHFHFSGNYTYNPQTNVINTYTVVIGHTHNNVHKHWQAEYDEVTRLIDETDIEVGDILKNVNDYIAANVVYDSNAQFNQEAYSALINKRSVCNGYALATSMLCLRMGLDVPYMNGKAGGAHAWNLNLEYYPDPVLLVDTTWARMQSGNTYHGISYDYFNKNLHYFRSVRSWSPYYESYIDYVHDKRNNLAPGMIFDQASIPDPVAVPGAEVKVPSLLPDASSFINLSTERAADMELPSDYGAITAYKVDVRAKNGVLRNGKWKAVNLSKGKSFDDKTLASLLNKGGIISISSSPLDTASKKNGVRNPNRGKPLDASKIIMFDEIAPRPKLGRYAINYEHYADSEPNGKWVMVVNNKKAANNGATVSSLEYASPDLNADEKGKIPGTFDGYDGIDVLGLNADGRQTRDVWFIREPPTAKQGGHMWRPASKAKKITAKGVSKAPALKTKETTLNGVKANVILVRKGLVYITAADPATIDIQFRERKGSISEPGEYTFWLPATAKKPMSAKSAPLTLG